MPGHYGSMKPKGKKKLSALQIAIEKEKGGKIKSKPTSSEGPEES